MDSNKVKAKCRKVFIPIADNRIFSVGDTGGEFDFVSVFRQEENAVRMLESRRHQYAFDKPEKANIRHSVEAFYLVPAKVIERLETAQNQSQSTAC